jgi:hypothetical protein
VLTASIIKAIALIMEAVDAAKYMAQYPRRQSSSSRRREILKSHHCRKHHLDEVNKMK